MSLRYCVCGWSGEEGDRWVDSLAAHRLTQDHALRIMEQEERRLDNIVWASLDEEEV